MLGDAVSSADGAASRIRLPDWTCLTMSCGYVELTPATAESSTAWHSGRGSTVIVQAASLTWSIRKSGAPLGPHQQKAYGRGLGPRSRRGQRPEAPAACSAGKVRSDMTRIIAAIDTVDAARVLRTAQIVARVATADVEAVHVPGAARTRDGQFAAAAAERANVPLRLLDGPTITAIVEATAADDVVACVIGTHSAPTGPGPPGHITRAVVERSTKPVFVVPPAVAAPVALRRVLVPLDDREAFAGHVAVVRALLEPAAVLVPLIVHTGGSAPIFDGLDGLEHIEWTSRLLAGATMLSEPVISRSGLSPAAAIVQTAQAGNFDLIALGWTQQLGPGQGQAVRQVLATATTPVLLLPQEPAGVSRAPALGPQHVVDRWGELVEILLVEHDPTHVRLTQEALDEIGLLNALHVVDSGETALAFLRHEPPYSDVPPLGLILMAVHLPGRSGLDVLREIKADPDLRAIPVVVLTSSEEGGDVQEAYRLGATCFITKPVRNGAFVAAVRDLGRFWFTTVTPPRARSGAAAPPG